MDEEDPAKCRALESSLWEIKVCTAACDGFGFTNESSMTLTTTELCLVSAKVFVMIGKLDEGLSDTLSLLALTHC